MKTDLRTDAAEYVLFLFVSLFAWSEVAIVLFLIFGRRPTLRGYLFAVGCFSICWALGYLPFRSIWEKIRGKGKAIQVNSPPPYAEHPPASMEPSQELDENQSNSVTATEVIASVPGSSCTSPGSAKFITPEIAMELGEP
jgi:hypothetical protein